MDSFSRKTQNSNQREESKRLPPQRPNKQLNMNKWEWTPELDKALQEIVVRNFFNFDMVSVELNEESRRLGLNFGATHVFTNEKCRFRYSYLHLKRQMGKTVKYKKIQQTTNKPIDESSKQQENQTPNKTQLAMKVNSSEPQKDLNSKSFEANYTLNKDTLTLGNLESELWKKNITTGPRRNRDYLDVSSEDFTKNTSLNIEGKEITPSNFNIFRDSLRQTSEQLLKTLNENLPEMNLREIEEESKHQTDEDDDDEEVLPLDFRTALIEEENKVVIQAKPLSLKTEEDLLREASQPFSEELQSHREFETMDSYLEAVKKEPFKQEEGNVIMIEPGINIKEKFDQIELACNKEQRINNTINAPVRTKEQIALAALSKHLLSQQQSPKSPAPKLMSKSYETDTDNDGNTDTELSKDQLPHQFKNKDLDFNNVLKQWGVSDLNKLIPNTSGSEDESARKKKEQKQVSSRVGIIEGIMKENRQAQQKRAEMDSMPQSIEALLDSLRDEVAQEEVKQAPSQSEEDSDVAPMSALVDTPSKEELKRIQQKRAQKSAQLASSASESESANEQKKQKKRVTFQEEDEVTMIDTSTTKQIEPAPTQAKQTKTSKVIMYKGVKIQSDNEDDQENKQASKSSSSGDSADEYFNQQRTMIKKRLIGDKKLQGQFDKDDINASSNDQEPSKNYFEDDENQDMRDFDMLMSKSLGDAQRLKEEEQRAAREESERLRVERLREQADVLRREQERKQRERDELMEKLKKQDEERKKRKREEKAKRDHEKEQKRRIEEEKRRKEEEDREREEEAVKKLREIQERAKREREENIRRKETFERSIKKIWNGSDIPCLFDSKIAYSRQLYTIPVELEEKIMMNEVPKEDITFRRYKSLLIPIESLFSRTSGLPMIELINYFLRYSNVPVYENTEQHLKTFPFKCIGMVQSVACPPFNKCSLAAVSQSENSSAQRVLTLLFDTHDHPKAKVNFNDALKQTKLSDLLSTSSLSELQAIYSQYLTNLAQDYLHCNKLKDFPYQVNVKSSPLLEFVNQQDLSFEPSNENLLRISFFMEYTIQDDIVPMTTKESWEFLRRYPTFYAYNPNPRTYTRFDSRDRLLTKYNLFHPENVCVIFKDLTFGRLDGDSNDDSLTYFLTRAVLEHGLEIGGMRMVYMDKEQKTLYEQLFNEKIQVDKGGAMLAMFIRGVDAIAKCEEIVGHFNPEMGRKTREESVRAFFGIDKELRNCALKMYASQKKCMSELIYWFGGRVQQEQSTLEIMAEDKAQQVPISTMYLVVPPKIEKQFLFLSPLVTTRELPMIIKTLSEFGVTVLDFQKINYEKLQYEGEGIREALNKDLCLVRVRGSTLLIQVGFVLKLAREGLVQAYKSKIYERIDNQMQHLDKQYGGLLYMTQGDKEYKILRQKVRQHIFNLNYSQLQIEHLKPKVKNSEDPANRTDYDSEDTENYRDLPLYNNESKAKKSPIKGGLQGPNKTQQNQSKVDTYETQTFLCFIKLSTMKKQYLHEVLSLILSQQTTGFELLGIKVLNAKREIYNELVPVQVRQIVKKVAFKFYSGLPDLRLRKKISEFKSIVLVLRGRNIEHNINKIYSLDDLTFKLQEFDIYSGTPKALFLTNQTLLDPVFDFLLTTKLIKLYTDFSLNLEHLLDSPFYSYLLHHNLERIAPTLATQISDPLIASSVSSVSNIVQIKSKEQLTDRQDPSSNKLSACVCVVKPNQPMTVALRTLKSIANNKELGLTIQNIEVTRYSERQIEMIYKHDIEYDEGFNSKGANSEAIKEQYFKMFREAKNSGVVQFLVSGPYAIAKIKQIIGHKDPKLAAKDSMRSFYGVDRVDNAYFISENFSESLIERDFLFSNENHLTPASLQALTLEGDQNVKKQIKSKYLPSVLTQTTNQLNNATNLLSTSHHQELALLLFSPTIVASNDFVFVLEDLHRSKFNICAIMRVSDCLERADLDFLFAEQAPRVMNIEVIEQLEFKKEGGCVMVVVEKEKAVSELSEAVGRLEIKSKTDFDKYKKRSSSSSSSMFSSYNNEQVSLVQEFGPYIFSFPIGGVQANQKKILRYFNSLPNSQHFEISVIAE